MRGKYDACGHCQLRGEMERCERAICSHHDMWYASKSHEENVLLRRAIKEAGFEILKASNGWSIHDVSKKAKYDEERTTAVIRENIDLILKVREQAAQVAKMQAIIDRLPKTADGVPVVDGDELFATDPNFDDQLDSLCVRTDAHWISQNGMSATDAVEQYYSTAEARDKAREAGQ